MMRISTTAVAVALLSFAVAACAQDPTDPKTVEKIAAKAIDREKMQYRKDLYYEPNRSEPYSGWIVEYHDPQNMAQLEGNESLPIANLRQYVDGKRHGQEMFWYDNGQMKSQGPTRDGDSNGQWTYWYENGQMRHQGDWMDNEFHGHWTFWYENGQMKEQGELVGGHWNTGFQRAGQWTGWYEDGEIWYQANFTDGPYTKWHENGQIAGEGDYVDGEKHGQWQWWWDDGTSRYSGECRNGERFGQWVYRRRNGEARYIVDEDSCSPDYFEPGDWWF